MLIGISANTSANTNVLIEEEGTTLIVKLTSSEPIPEGGLVVSLSSNLENVENEFNIFGVITGTAFEGAEFAGLGDDTLDIRLLEQTGTLSIPIADDNVPDGTNDFTFRVEPGEGYTVDSNASSATVIIDDAESNNPPIARNDSYTVQSGQTLNIDNASGVLANDSDVDIQAAELTASIANNPSNGSVTLNNDGSFEYTPNDGFSGSDSFSYTVNDGEANSEPATVEINVEKVNSPPVAQNDSYTVQSGQTFNIDSDSGVLTNDSDPEGDQLTASIANNPSNGSVTLNNDGSFDYRTHLVSLHFPV